MKWILRVQPLRWYFQVAGCILLFLALIVPAIVLWFINQWPLDKQPETPLEAYEVIVVGTVMIFGPGLVITTVLSLIGYWIYRIWKRRHPEEVQVESSASD